MNFKLGFVLRIIAAILMLIGFVDDMGANLDSVDNPDANSMINHVGLLGLHGNFYFVQKVLITAVCIYMIFSALEVHRNIWIIGYALVIIIYNPVIPLSMGRMLWIAADFISAVFFIISLVTFKNPENQKKDPRKMKLPYQNKPRRF